MVNIILKLLKNRIIQLLGIATIFYFGLLSNKENKDSLGYRLSQDNIKQNIEEVNQRSRFIMASLQQANAVANGDYSSEQVKEKLAKYQESNASQNYAFLKSEDVAEGEGQEVVKCDDQVNISYEIFIKQNGVKLEEVTQEKIIIGSNINPVLEQKIVGMKKNSVRIINIPRYLKVNETKLSALLKFNETDLYYRVQVHNFFASDIGLKCLWNAVQ